MMLSMDFSNRLFGAHVERFRAGFWGQDFLGPRPPPVASAVATEGGRGPSEHVVEASGIAD
jgi:hypothetical protein